MPTAVDERLRCGKGHSSRTYEERFGAACASEGERVLWSSWRWHLHSFGWFGFAQGPAADFFDHFGGEKALLKLLDQYQYEEQQGDAAEESG